MFQGFQELRRNVELEFIGGSRARAHPQLPSFFRSPLESRKQPKFKWLPFLRKSATFRRHMGGTMEKRIDRPRSCTKRRSAFGRNFSVYGVRLDFHGERWSKTEDKIGEGRRFLLAHLCPIKKNALFPWTVRCVHPPSQPTTRSTSGNAFVELDATEIRNSAGQYIFETRFPATGRDGEKGQ